MENVTANGLRVTREFAKLVMLDTVSIMMVLVLSALTHYVLEQTLTELVTFAPQDQSEENWEDVFKSMANVPLGMIRLPFVPAVTEVTDY